MAVGFCLATGIFIAVMFAGLGPVQALPREKPTDLAPPASLEPIPSELTGAAPTPAVAGCPDGDPLALVWDRNHLQLLNPCEEVNGTVVAIGRLTDGDIHVWIAPDKGFEFLVNAANVFRGHTGVLVLEIMPNCSSPPDDGRESSLCPPSKIPVPHVGQHIRALGAWVLNIAHHWNEIHPVNVLTSL